MEDHVQPKIGLVFITMREWFPCHLLKGGTRASECIECSEKFLFLYENFQIDSKTVRINGYSQYTVISEISSTPFYDKSGGSFSENYY